MKHINNPSPEFTQLRDALGNPIYPITKAGAIISDGEEEDHGSNIEFMEVLEAPTEPPMSNSILLDTVHGLVYFGIKSKGWWKTCIKNANGSVSINVDTFVVEGYGEVNGHTLILNNGTVTNNILTV